MTRTFTCRVHIPRAGQGGAAHGGAAGPGGDGQDGQDGTPTGRFAQNTTVPFTLQTTEKTLKACL